MKDAVDARPGASVDARLREELLAHYERLGARARPARVRVHVKRIAWLLVVRGSYLLKRVIDVAGAALLLVALAPLLLAVALAIVLEAPGPVLFAQTRVGRRGRPFRMWKFRSMRTDAEAAKAALRAHNEMPGGVTFKMRSDPRVTRVGRVLRRSSLDELPQLWNVLIGEMSLVGPRPPLPEEVAAYSLSDRRRLETIPGMTCLWQVGGRSEIPFAQQVELDDAYIQNQTLWGDVVILLRTIPAVLLGRGAY